jgi:hypothetical protein
MKVWGGLASPHIGQLPRLDHQVIFSSFDDPQFRKLILLL